ncbi:MAG TPA: hypothetical protein VMA75_04100 [Candidatus Paceibacterota bacterium]|nr:hypothetical protein [Candidatus Paceibacterota bacterium]
MKDDRYEVVGNLVSECKYGENAWQAPAQLFQTDDEDALALHRFTLVAGTEPSYNNLCDIDRMLQTITHMRAVLGDLLAVAVKHGNACGAAHDINPGDVIKKMIWGDPRAIFGGLVMVTFPVDLHIAMTLLRYQMTTGKRVLDGVIAPSFTPAATELLSRKEGKCRLIENPALLVLRGSDALDRNPRFRFVRGGFLRQPNYTFVLDLLDPRIEHYGRLVLQQLEDLKLAWAIGCTSNSNTITLVKDGRLIGNGVGQQDRVGCCELAIKRARDAGHEIEGAVAYSDSFFPFPDGPEVLAKAGIKAILASSGSLRDAVVKETCEKLGVTLLMIPDPIGRGFYNH